MGKVFTASKARIFMDNKEIGIARDWSISLTQNATAAMEAMGRCIEQNVVPDCRAFCKVSSNFNDSFFSAACGEYLKHHRRLPGSDKTKRLKKKRRVKVIAWYWRRLTR